MLASIFLWFVGYNAIETFFTSYGVQVLGIKERQASLLSSISYIPFILFSVPSGYVAARIGRRKTITTGLLVFAGLLLGVLCPQHLRNRCGSGVGRLCVGPGEHIRCPWSWTLHGATPTSGPHQVLLSGVTTRGDRRSGAQRGGDREVRSYGLVLLMPVIFFILAAGTMQQVTRSDRNHLEAIDEQADGDHSQLL